MYILAPYLDLDKIAESGQCFRWEKTGDRAYRIPAFGKVLNVRHTAVPDEVELDCSPQDYYGTWAQEEMAIEEMSELTKAIVKRHRAKDKPSYDRAMNNIAEEMADVIIMLTQLLMFYGNRKDVQRAVDEKVKRLAGRLESERAEMTGAAMDAAAEALQSAT